MSDSEPTPVDELLTYLDGLGWESLYTAAPPEPDASPARPSSSARSSSTREPSSTAQPSQTAPSVDSPLDGPQGGLFGSSVVSSAAGLTAAQRRERLDAVCSEAQSCVACRLAGGRQNVVFGTGDPDADLMFIGEGPGADEDRQGEPFVGAAGQLLNKIIAAIDMRRDEVYICNMVKCRPPNNRDPQPDEMAACRGFLEQQIDLVQPRVIVTLGRIATQALLDTKQSLGRLRGRWHTVRGAAMRATYHPAALLRYTSYKRPTWEDMKVVRDHLQALRAEGA